MKISLIFLAILALAHASPYIIERHQVKTHDVESKTLKDLYDQFVAFIPLEDCVAIVKRYEANDPDVIAAYEFLRSDEFQAMLDTLRAMPEYTAFVQYLADAGVDYYKVLNFIRSVLDLPPLSPRHHRRQAEESGVIRMIKEVLSILPIEDIKTWFYNVCLPDPDFQALIAKLQSPDFINLVETVYNSPEYKELTDILRSQGIDVEAIEQAIRDFLNISRIAPQSLKDLYEQFVAFIPLEECVAIVKRYEASDPDVIAAYDFLRSDEFQAMLDVIRAMPEYKAFVQYLADAGVDYYKVLNFIRSVLDLPPLSPRHHRRQAEESGVIRMIKEVLSILPIEDIKTWFYNVCLPDPDFQALIAKLQSPDFINLVETVYNSPEYKELTDILRSQGIDVEAIEQAIRDFLNISRIAPQSLKDLYEQFVAFIPLEECVAIVKRYEASDPDVIAAYDFLRSDEFQAMLDVIRAMPEYKAFVQYLADAGVDYYKVLNFIRSVLDLPPLSPRHHRRQAEESGVIRMIKEVLSILPIEDIKTWFYNVCLPDPDFQALIAKLQSPDFINLVETVYNSPEYKELTDILRSQGIDVEAIEQAIRDFLNISRIAPQSLKDLYEQFVAFIPLEECVAIVKRYEASDPDVIAAYDFLRSDEFQAMLDVIRAMPEYKAFVQYLADAGVDYYKVLNFIRSVLDLPPLSPRHHRRQAEESGVIRMIKEVLSILPIEDIKTWFYNVCLPDPDFQALIAKLQSPDFINLVETVYNSPEYKELTDILRSQGIDVEAIEQAIRDFLNISRIAPQSLKDLYEQFVAFIPLEECVAIVKRYEASDPDVIAAYDFLRSDEFQAMLDVIRAMPEYKAFVQYLADAGVDYYKVLNFIRSVLDLPPLSPRHHRRQAEESGVIRMIKEVLSILPIEDIKTWFYNVCLPDPDFQALIAKLQSPDFINLVETVYNSPEYKELTDILRSQGIDVEAIEQAIRDFLNISRIAPQSLKDLYEQFVAFIPLEECVAIVKRYEASDPDVIAAYDFLRSAEFQAMLDVIRAMPEYKAFVQYLADAGVDYYKVLNFIRSVLDLPPLSPRHHRRQAEESGVIRMIKEVLSILPIEDIKTWFYNVCLPDPDFQALIAKLQSPDFINLVETVYNSPEYKELTDILRSQGIDVEAIEQAIRDFLNISRIAPQSLKDLYEQFVAFIPLEECVAIVKRYEASDPDVIAAYDFLRSAEFQAMLDVIRAMPEYKAFVQYLADAGVDYYKVLNFIRSVLDLPPLSPRHHRRQAEESGVIRMIKEVLSILPIEDIKTWFYNVCLPDPDFQALIAKLQSPDFINLVETVYNSPEYKELTDILRSQGIDVEAIEQAIRDFLNISRIAPQSLKDLYEQFVAFIPLEECVAIVKRYEASDPDVIAAYDFLRSDEFQAMLDVIRAMPEYKAFVQYLADAGVDYYKVLNFIRSVLDLPPLSPRHHRRQAEESGVIRMIKEVLSILPIEDIKTWFYNVCLPDPDFQALIAKLQSPDFINLVETVYNSPEYKELTDILRSQGIDVEAIEQAIRDFLNITRFARKA